MPLFRTSCRRSLCATKMAVYFPSMYLCGASLGPLITGRFSDYLAPAPPPEPPARRLRARPVQLIGLHQAMDVIPGDLGGAGAGAMRDRALSRRTCIAGRSRAASYSTIRPMRPLIFSGYPRGPARARTPARIRADYYGRRRPGRFRTRARSLRRDIAWRRAGNVRLRCRATGMNRVRNRSPLCA